LNKLETKKNNDEVFKKEEKEDGGLFDSIKFGEKDIGDGAADNVDIGNTIFINLR